MTGDAWDNYRQATLQIEDLQRDNESLRTQLAEARAEVERLSVTAVSLPDPDLRVREFQEIAIAAEAARDAARPGLLTGTAVLVPVEISDAMKRAAGDVEIWRDYPSHCQIFIQESEAADIYKALLAARPTGQDTE